MIHTYAWHDFVSWQVRTRYLRIGGVRRWVRPYVRKARGLGLIDVCLGRVIIMIRWGLASTW